MVLQLKFVQYIVTYTIISLAQQRLWFNAPLPLLWINVCTVTMVLHSTSPINYFKHG